MSNEIYKTADWARSALRDERVKRWIQTKFQEFKLNHVPEIRKSLGFAPAHRLILEYEDVFKKEWIKLLAKDAPELFANIKVEFRRFDNPQYEEGHPIVDIITVVEFAD